MFIRTMNVSDFELHERVVEDFDGRERSVLRPTDKVSRNRPESPRHATILRFVDLYLESELAVVGC